ncbi:hypothetical protein [Thetidibacter halocola]|uniref:Uncharacterized protein n=1 Tax=Thetidibacter halocola TaxID=2827239 RepID=A0A8J8B7R0_9RHOB|nr:hypothetical protein [Thetidibacter halocola]MBS0123964.1 hypothetical protein [Thetidibacter halocola]
MIAQAINATAGIGIGVFLGCLIGFGIRARSGKREGLVMGSVWKTAVLAGMLAWSVAALGSMAF